MTTDITELAQSLKAAAEKATPGRWEYYPGNTSIEYNVDSMDEDQGSIVYVDSGDFTQAQTDRNGEFIALANPASILALVEVLEKAENTAGVAGMAESYETTISMLKSRISELEESHAQVIQSRDHYKRMTEEGLKQLAKSRAVTVKLPDIMPPEAAPAHYWGPGESIAYADGYNKSATDLKTSFAQACSSVGVNVEFE